MNINIDKKSGRSVILLLIAIFLIAANLRAPIVAPGPVIPQIREALSLSPSSVSLITTIPLFCFAFGSVFMPGISERFGLEKTLIFSIVLLVAGLVTRSLGAVSYLFLGSVFIGIAITIANVLMPAFIKKYFPLKVGLVTALYLASMNLTSALAVGFSIEIGRIGGMGWKMSIGIWAIISVLAFIFWLPILKMGSRIKIKQVRKVANLWRSPLAWQISIFMGLQSVIFYALAAWFPTILQDWGMDPSRAGWMLSYLQMGQVPVMIFGPLLAGKMKSQVPLVWFLFITLLLGLLLLLFWKTEYAIIASVLMGIAIGLAFALSTMFFVLRTKAVEEAAGLSGMAQSVGYLLAACFPPLFGFLFSLTSSWEIPLYTLIAASFIILLTGIPAARDRYIQEGTKH